MFWSLTKASRVNPVIWRKNNGSPSSNSWCHGDLWGRSMDFCNRCLCLQIWLQYSMRQRSSKNDFTRLSFFLLSLVIDVMADVNIFTREWELWDVRCIVALYFSSKFHQIICLFAIKGLEEKQLQHTIKRFPSKSPASLFKIRNSEHDIWTFRLINKLWQSCIVFWCLFFVHSAFWEGELWCTCSRLASLCNLCGRPMHVIIATQVFPVGFSL